MLESYYSKITNEYLLYWFSNDWKMKKYLVTGGAGFIGSALSKYLLKKGHHVTIIDTLSTGFKENIPNLGKRFLI